MTIECEVRSDNLALLEFFRNEYTHFYKENSHTDGEKSPILIKFQKATQPLPPFRTLLKTEVCKMKLTRRKRIYLYNEGSYAFDYSDGQRRILRFFYNDVTTGVEEGNLFLLSVIGELVEDLGYVRLHACGFSNADGACVFPGDSGFGKSTLAKEILLKTEHSLLSDEMVLTDGKQFYPFPISVSLKEAFSSDQFSVKHWQKHRRASKWQIQIPLSRVSTGTEPGKIYLSTEMSVFQLGVRILSGYGLVQMKEYFIRADNLSRLVRIFFRRLTVLFRLLPLCEKIEVEQRQSQKILNLLVKRTDF